MRLPPSTQTIIIPVPLTSYSLMAAMRVLVALATAGISLMFPVNSTFDLLSRFGLSDDTYVSIAHTIQHFLAAPNLRLAKRPRCVR